MVLTYRQIITGTIPTIAAILGFFWFRRRRKDPAIEWKKEEANKKSTELQNAQKQNLTNVKTEQSSPIEEAVLVAETKPLLQSKPEASIKETAKTDDTLTRDISSIENQILHIKQEPSDGSDSLGLEKAEDLLSVVKQELPDQTSEVYDAISSNHQEQSATDVASIQSTHTEITEDAPHIEHGNDSPNVDSEEVCVNESIIKEESIIVESVPPVEAHPLAADETAIQDSETDLLQQENISTVNLSTVRQSWADEVQTSDELVSANTDITATAATDDAPSHSTEIISSSSSLPDAADASSNSAESETSTVAEAAKDLTLTGDENANTDLSSQKSLEPADYSQANGHVETAEESQLASGDHIQKTEVAKTSSSHVSHPAGDMEQSNGDGTDAQSEVSSDSGRGASGIETPTATSPSELSDYIVYEFDFPSECCGKLIGKNGKNINSVKAKSGAEIILKRKPFVREYQNCCIEGTHGQVQAALEQIKRRFPPKHYGNITYKQTNVVDETPMLAPGIMQVCLQQLSLPEGVSVDVCVSSVVSANHVFVQQPTHPTFSSLESLNYCMNLCYTQDNVVPQLPRPIDAGVICAAPVFQGWYRAQVMTFNPATDECDIKYVDYGGYMRVGASTLRQIRSDFATLPFQAVECYLANVMPLEGQEEFGMEAAVVLENLVQGQMLQAQITEHESDGVPYVQIYNLNGPQAVFINRELVEAGTASWVESQG